MTKENLKFGLLFFYDDNQKNNFINEINNYIKKTIFYKGQIIENQENFIIKENKASWDNNYIYNVNEIKKTELNIYRIILLKINDYNIYYFEKNGAIHFIDIILKKYNFDQIDKKNFNKEKFKDNESLINKIKEYYNNQLKEDYKNEFDNIYIKENIDIENFKFDYFEFLNFFIDIKEINQEYKLPSYIIKDCSNNENKYNKLVYEQNKNKYILLDCKLINGCEVADLYDKENNLLFHNKKNGDLRVLTMQIIIGALIMKNKEKKDEYIKHLRDKEIYDKIDNNFKYVIGIIGKNKNIAQKDKISLGLVNYILKKHNIELFIDFINEEENIINNNEEDDLSKLSLSQLKEKCKSLGITGYSKLNKSELIDKINNK
jgi:hypothetical protein